MKLRTPLQVQLHLTLAMEAGCQTGETPITATLFESVLSCQLDDLEPTLTRRGYRLKDMVEPFDAKPAEIRALFDNQLDPARVAELRDRMLAVSLDLQLM
ncbi:phosphoribulokinase (plasmid) [Enterobacter roggenkampii]|nr:phosphoribulokinase [Enterobacter roggenkampii]